MANRDGKAFRVAVMPADKITYGRRVLSGIYQYANLSTLTSQWIIAKIIDAEQIKDELHSSSIDGIIGHFHGGARFDEVFKLGIPTVNTSGVNFNLPALRVGLQDEEIGRMAAEYFHLRGFSTVGIMTTSGDFSIQREAGFRRAAQEFQLRCIKIPPVEHSWVYSISADLLKEHEAFFLSLPKPIGIFASTDEFGRKCCDFLSHIGINVPNEVAVLGADDDEIYCTMNRPALSTVQIPAERVGYEAARLLDQLMHGGARPTEPILLSPLRVITRKSTEAFPTEDKEIAAAARYIHAHAQEPISIEDILAAVPLSRRMFEIRFQQAFSCSPHTMLSNTRLELAKEMLLDLDLLIPEVATRAGFSSLRTMERTMMRVLNTTPNAFRKRAE